MTNIWFRHSIPCEHRVKQMIGCIRTTFRNLEPNILFADDKLKGKTDKKVEIFDRLCEAQLGLFCFQVQGFTDDISYEMKVLIALNRPVYVIDATTFNISRIEVVGGQKCLTN